MNLRRLFIPVAVTVLGFLHVPGTGYEARERDQFSDWNDLYSEEFRNFYGSEREEKFPVLSPVLRIEKWDQHYSLEIPLFYKFTDYPEFRSNRAFFPFLPVYRSLESKKDDRYKSWLFPFYYRKHEKQRKELVTPVGYWFRDSTGYQTSFLWLFYTGKNESIGETYHGIFPLYYTEKSVTETSSERMIISPLFYHYHNETETDQFSLLHYYHYRKKSEGSPDISLGFPVIPLIQYKQSSDQRRVNVLWFLISAGWKKGEGLTDSWFFPLFYFSNDEDSVTFLSVPFSYYGDENEADYNSIGILHWNWNRSENHLQTAFALPFFVYNRNTFLMALPFWMRWRSEDRSEGFSVSPFHFHAWEDGKRDYSALWLFWRSVDDSENSRNLHILPLYYSWKNPENNGSLFIPFYYYNETPDSWTFLSLPFSRYSDPALSHVNVMLLFDWQYDRTEEKTDSLNILPVFSYRREKQLALLPVYLRKGNQHKGFSVSPLHFSRWDDDGSLSSLGWLHWRGNSHKEKSEFFHIFPFYYSWNNPEFRARAVLPVYLSYEDENTDFTLAAGFYSGQSSGYILPGVTEKDGISYYYLDSDLSLFYDLFSIRTRVSVPSPFQNTEETKKNLRISFVRELTSETEESAVPRVHKKGKADRETSLSFFRFNMLFGAFSYARSDSRRHLRVLPLAWISWDKENDDRLFMFPPFLPLYFDYQSDVERYLVIFPFYALHRDGESYTKSVLLNGYIKRYNAETQEKSVSVLWPLIRWSSSPVKTTLRIPPFWWYKRERKSGSEHYRYITPVFASWGHTAGSESQCSHSSLSLFHYYSRACAHGGSSVSLFIPLLPLAGFFEDNDEVSRIRSHYVFPLYYYRSEYIKMSDGSADYSEGGGKSAEIRKSAFLLTPLYASWSAGSRNPDNSKCSGGSVSPLHYYSRKCRKDSESVTVLVPVLPLFGMFSESEPLYRRSSSYLLPLYYYSSESSRDNPESEFLSRNSTLVNPLFTWHSDSDKSEKWFVMHFPFYYRYSGPDHSHTNIMGVFDYKYSRIMNKTAGLVIFPLFMYQSWDDGWGFYSLPFMTENHRDYYWFFAAGLYWETGEDYGRRNFLYLLDHEYSHKENYYRYSALFRAVNSVNTDYYSQLSVLYGGLVNYVNYKNSDDYEFSMLLRIYYQENMNGRFSNGLFPLYHYSKSEYETNIYFPSVPFIYYHQRRPDGRTDLILSGLLYYRNQNLTEGYDRSLYLGGLAYYNLELPERGYRSRGSAWGLLWEYETEKETDYRSWSVLSFVYSKTYYKGEESKRIFGIRL